MQPLFCDLWFLSFILNFSFLASDAWKDVPTWPLFFILMLVYLSCFFMLWTINKARKCFSGYKNIIISSKPPSNVQTAVICVCTRAGLLVDTEPGTQRLQRAQQHMLILGGHSSLLLYSRKCMRAESKAAD